MAFWLFSFFLCTIDDFVLPVLAQLGWGLCAVPSATTGPALPRTGGGCRDGRSSVPCAAESSGFRGWMDNCKQLNYSGLMSLHISAKPHYLVVCWPGCICEIKQLSLSLPPQWLQQKRIVLWVWKGGCGLLDWEESHLETFPGAAGSPRTAHLPPWL